MTHFCLGKSTFIREFIEKRGEKRTTYLVNYISSGNKQLKNQSAKEDKKTAHWKKISWDQVHKLRSCNIVFEDLICMSNKERTILLNTLNHQSHHANLHIVCCVVHRLLCTGIYIYTSILYNSTVDRLVFF